jgi:hypothetical protein
MTRAKNSYQFQEDVMAFVMAPTAAPRTGPTARIKRRPRRPLAVSESTLPPRTSPILFGRAPDRTQATLTAAGTLTPDGERFVRGMRSAVGTWADVRRPGLLGAGAPGVAPRTTGRMGG